MRRWLEPMIRRVWSGEAGAWGALASTALVPLELVYRGAVAARNAAYDRGGLPRIRAEVPVVSVGNLLVGGTGKTPVSAWIARVLADAARAPAVVSRGYGSDELRLHRWWNPDVPVFADPDRSRGVAEAAAAGCRSVVLDDGFQHRRLRRTLDLVLLPVEGPWRVRLLPRGPYREPPSSLLRADRAILTRRTGDRQDARDAERRLRDRFPDLPLTHLRLAPDGWSTPAGEEVAPPRGPLLAVTGIARPRAFRDLVRHLTGSKVELLSFPDHHDFTPGDLEEIRRRAGSRTVVTTEKDAVRLGEAPEVGRRVRVLRLRVEEEGGAELRGALLAATDDAPTSSARSTSDRRNPDGVESSSYRVESRPDGGDVDDSFDPRLP